MSVSDLRSAPLGAPPHAEATVRPRLGRVLTAAGVLLIPWLAVLAAEATCYAWLALDSLEVVGLVTTGVLAARAAGVVRAAHLVPPAAATAALLLLDAAFDLATSHGAALLAAVAMAVLAELPLAAACALLALTAAHVRVQQPSSRLPR